MASSDLAELAKHLMATSQAMKPCPWWSWRRLPYPSFPQKLWGHQPRQQRIGSLQPVEDRRQRAYHHQACKVYSLIGGRRGQFSFFGFQENQIIQILLGTWGRLPHSLKKEDCKYGLWWCRSKGKKLYRFNQNMSGKKKKKKKGGGWGEGSTVCNYKRNESGKI